PDDDQRPLQILRSIERGAGILPSLDGADEQEVALAVAESRRERGIDAVRDDADLLLWNPVEVEQVVARPIRDGDDAVGLTRRARDGRLEDEPILPRLQAGGALGGAAVQGGG